jgi:hypothetical protein
MTKTAYRNFTFFLLLGSIWIGAERPAMAQGAGATSPAPVAAPNPKPGGRVGTRPRKRKTASANSVERKLTPKTISLLIVSSPGSSAVAINGESRGVTDAAGELEVNLPPGIYAVRVTRDGYVAREADVEVATSPTEQQVEFSLPLALVTLNVVTTPPESEVYLDEVYRGTSNAEGMIVFDRINPNQPHMLRVRKSGFMQQSAPVTSYSGQISIKLLPDSIKLKVVTDPAGAEVYIDDSYKGTSTETGVLVVEEVNPNQKHTLRAKKDGYLTAITTVQANETQVSIKLSSDPVVTILKDLNKQLTQGNINEAFRLYGQLVQNAPDHRDLPRLLDTLLLGLQSHSNELLKRTNHFGVSVEPNTAEELSDLFARARKLRPGDEDLDTLGKYWRLKYLLSQATGAPTEAAERYKQEAKPLLSELAEINIRNSSLLLDLGWAWTTFNEPARAQKYFSAAQEQKPDWAYPHFAIGHLAAKDAEANRAKSARNAKFSEAIERFNRAIDLKHDFARAYSARSLVLANLKLYDQAIASGLQATTLDPQSAHAHFALGSAYFFKGKSGYRNARDELTRALAVGGRELDAQLILVAQQQLAQISRSIK